MTCWPTSRRTAFPATEPSTQVQHETNVPWPKRPGRQIEQPAVLARDSPPQAGQFTTRVSTSMRNAAASNKRWQLSQTTFMVVAAREHRQLRAFVPLSRGEFAPGSRPGPGSFGP